ncbi:MAG: Nif3-like dinuclear metal center hexameric protein [Candidatus Saccharibacteria bacterium]|nr:Nif3-like dinuclear metal center hexameric protein [Candidatus Saccharibacteria bacterium]
MKISEVIQNIKNYHGGTSFDGKPIDEETTRDKVLYGETDKECTGIVTCIWASSNVIREAHQRGANLIISHEALFWNHGDHTDWLSDNEIFQKKKALLDETGITVWRNHDYIHSGIPVDGKLYDGIFLGLLDKLGWRRYVILNEGRIQRLGDFHFPNIKAIDLANEMIEKLGLNGIRIIGDPNTVIKRARLAPHIIGPGDNEVTKATDRDQIDCLFSMELTDFTVNEYIRDSAELGHPRCIITLGHFNGEQPGMEYAVKWLPEAIKDSSIPVSFVSDGDVFQYVIKK